MHEAEKKQVIEAIGSLGRRVTTADVCTKTGFPLHIVSQNLNAIAAETGGHLQVSPSGDLAYVFAPGFSNSYLTKGFQLILEKAAKKMFVIAFYLLRISFGIILIVSFLIVITLVTILLLRGLRGSTRDGDDDGFGFQFNFINWLILRDLLYWNTYISYPATLDYSKPTVKKRPRSNFLLNCFSFLFGDGNPNEGLTEKRWQLIAQVIRKNNNVMTAEQFAPYTGANPKNEDAVLPILVRFNGSPEVSESGNIIYVFPSLQAVAASSTYHNLPSYLKEFPWKFTAVPAADLIPVYMIAGLNFFGSWWLWSLVPAGSALIPLLSFLLVYGTAFLAIPALRYGIISLLNERIKQRNDKNFQLAQQLERPPVELQNKLSEAVDYKLKENLIKRDKVVYTTEQNALDQEDDLELEFKKKLEHDFDASP